MKKFKSRHEKDITLSDIYEDYAFDLNWSSEKYFDAYNLLMKY